MSMCGIMCYNLEQPEANTVGRGALQMHPDRSKYFEKKKEAFDRRAKKSLLYRHWTDCVRQVH